MRYVALAALMLIACAKGGASDDGDDTSGDPDAPVSTIDAPAGMIDAAVTPMTDARPDASPPDAFVSLPDAVPPPPDAMVTNPPFCDDNADCVEPGTCCFVIACVSGIPIGPDCLPT